MRACWFAMTSDDYIKCLGWYDCYDDMHNDHGHMEYLFFWTEQDLKYLKQHIDHHLEIMPEDHLP